MDEIAISTSNSKLTEHAIKRVVNFIYQLDAFVADFRPPGTQPLSFDFQPLFNGQEEPDSDTGYRLLGQHQEKCATVGHRVTKEDAQALLMYVVATAMHCAAEALRAETFEESAAFLADARYLLGYATGIVWSGDNTLLRAEFSQKGGEATKAAFAPRKKGIFDWCESNFAKYRSVSSAAQEASIAVPMAVKTAVKYINEWKSTKI